MKRNSLFLFAAILLLAAPSLSFATITPNPFAFGDVETGDSSPPQIFTMTNTLPEDMTIVSAVIGGANPDQYVLESTTCTVGLVIDPGNNCTLTVRFAPNATGNQVALIRVTVNAPPPNPPGGIEYNATLSGNGTEPPPPPPAAAVAVPTLGWSAIAIAAILMLIGAAMSRRQRVPGSARHR